MVLGTVIGTEFVVGHKHLANLSVLHSSFLTSGLQNFPSHSWGGRRGIDKSQLRMRKDSAQSQVPVQEAGAAATVGGSSKPTAEWDKAWVIFFPVCWHVGGFFSFFSSLLLSAVSTEMWEFANLSQWKGEEKLISGVLVRDQGSRKGHCNSGSKKTRTHSPMISLGRGRFSLSFPLEAAGVPSRLC